MQGTQLRGYSTPRRFAVVAALWTGQHVRVLAFAACGSPWASHSGPASGGSEIVPAISVALRRSASEAAGGRRVLQGREAEDLCAIGRSD